MSWRDTLAAAPHNSHNPHNYQPTGVSEDCGNTGDRAQAYDTYVSTRAAELRGQAQAASTWAELYGVLEAAQADFDTRAVTREEVESLSGYASDRSREVPEHAKDDRLSDLLARQPVARVRSRMLGEVVVWLADEAEAPEDSGESRISGVRATPAGGPRPDDDSGNPPGEAGPGRRRRG